MGGMNETQDLLGDVIFEQVAATKTKGFTDIIREYLPGTSLEHLAAKEEDQSGISAAAYVKEGEGKKLIGIVYGWPRTELIKDDPSFALDGIAVISPYNQKGIGSKLLDYWEGLVQKAGYRTTQVGSAPGYVETFYMNHQYVPVAYKAFSKSVVTVVQPIRVNRRYLLVEKPDVMVNLQRYMTKPMKPDMYDTAGLMAKAARGARMAHKPFMYLKMTEIEQLDRVMVERFADENRGFLVLVKYLG